jgi:hypothetical protein
LWRLWGGIHLTANSERLKREENKGNNQTTTRIELNFKLGLVVSIVKI